MSELEKKLRAQNSKHEKDLKAVEEQYTAEIKSLNKKIAKYEEQIKNNSFNNTSKVLDVNNFATKYSHRGEAEKLTDRTDRGVI